MVFLHLTRSGYKVQLDLLFSNMSWKSISADRATYRGCQHQSGWRHPGWSHWGWTCSSACYRSPWSTPAADKGVFFSRVIVNCQKSNGRFLDLGHVVVVLGEIGELLIWRELHLVVVVAVLRHGCSGYPTWGEETNERRCYCFAFPS